MVKKTSQERESRSPTIIPSAGSELLSTSNKRKRKKSSAENVSPPSASIGTEEPASVDDTAVLSHAASRKQRKKVQALKEHLVDGEKTPSLEKSNGTRNKGNKTTAAPANAAKKRQNSVWVGNLSFKTTQQQLEQFFQFAGEITRVHLPTKGDGSGKAINRG
jgi:RNA recognition motif-containing protein